jgi:CheY-like chemotaxis protein
MEGLPIVVVVEDNHVISCLIEDALRDGGFEFASVASGEEAITLLHAANGGYQAIATDINLLGPMDGWEVARRVREIDPDFPVVYLTGSDAEEWTSKGVPNSIVLSKPFATAQLVTAVSQLLNPGAGREPLALSSPMTTVAPSR